jgi:hypothetical protein
VVALGNVVIAELVGGVAVSRAVSTLMRDGRLRLVTFCDACQTGAGRRRV